MKLEDIVKNIIFELTTLQSVPVARRTDGDDFPLPRMIAAGDGGGIVVSKKIDDAIADVAKLLLDNDPSLKTRYTQAEWRAAVRRSFGPALASIDLDDKPQDNAKLVLSSVRDVLSKDQSREISREHAFGCTLFSDANIAPFAIGPVRFETRDFSRLSASSTECRCQPVASTNSSAEAPDLADMRSIINPSLPLGCWAVGA